ncbi:hypothetical protein, partial [Serratia sp. ASV30]|uniref:hypothetical protein n=1 Tax=Serratia sp. ASV30 TaxID=2795127 RepID=UPI001E32D0A7
LSVILIIEVLMTIVYNVEAQMAVSRKNQHLIALNNMDKNPSMVFYLHLSIAFVWELCDKRS